LTTQKKPWVAFLLSVLLTGAGLAYLGKWGWAALNFVIAIGIGITAALISPDLAGPVGIGVCVGSAVLAKNMADKMNKEAAAPQYTGTQPSPVITAGSSFSSKSAEPIFVKSATVLCPKCGTAAEDASFCAECGASLS
jgi:hypothetical protein